MKENTSLLRPDGYIPRIVDAQVDKYLELFGAVEIAGTKWCGKTWTACAHANSITYLDEGINAELANDDPLLVLDGERPHVVDEWQRVPRIWNVVRHEIDKTRKLRGAWILTGSSTPNDEGERHSGAGRIGRVRMMPMTLSESGDSTGSVSLSGLFDGRFKSSAAPHDTKKLVELCCRGGWPETFDDSVENAQEVARQYLRAIYEQSAPAHRKNSVIVERLIQSIARNLGQSPTYKTLLADMFSDVEKGPTEKTIASYIEFLRRIFLIEEIPGWVPPTRSPKRLQTKPRRYFADPSLAVAALGLSVDGLISDWQTFGLVFENLCIRDLSVYAQAIPMITSMPVKYYHDDSGLEADAVIELTDGRWAAFEIKVSEEKVPQGVKSLKRLRKKVSENSAAHVRTPEFLAVITGNGEYARKIEDGIYSIPIRTLTV